VIIKYYPPLWRGDAKSRRERAIAEFKNDLARGVDRHIAIATYMRALREDSEDLEAVRVVL
jgi:hypothetical protein